MGVVQVMRQGALRGLALGGRAPGRGWFRQTIRAALLAGVAALACQTAALAQAGVEERFTYVSSAGGAFLEWLEGKTLPGVAALQLRRAA